MTALKLMKGVAFSAKAHRSEAEENITVRLEARDSGAMAVFFLTREEAYDLAQRLQHQADWLARLDPQPVKP